MGETLGALYVGAWIAGLFILALWVVLPFAVFGLKGLVRECLEQQRKTNELLAQLHLAQLAGKACHFQAFAHGVWSVGHAAGLKRVCIFGRDC